MSTPAEPFRASPIPQPTSLPLLGNLPQIMAGESPFAVFHALAERYGPIYALDIAGVRRIIVSDPDLATEVADDRRFKKEVPPGLVVARAIVGDGLFTSDSDDPVWGHAHRILMPAFRRDAMQRYIPDMMDSIDGLARAWAGRPPGAAIDVARDMTRLTLDIISRTGFSARFNAFDREEPEPFLAAMYAAMSHAMTLGARPPLVRRLMRRERMELEAAARVLHLEVDRIIAARRADPALLERQRDLLSLMLLAADPETGARLSDENVRFQVLTFLIAGHDTTASTMSWALRFLISHPDVLAAARAEADEVLGGEEEIDFKHALKLRYMVQVLNETLRLAPPAPAFARQALAPTVIGGRYEIPMGDTVVLLLKPLHRNRQIWGEDADAFNPDRFGPTAPAHPRGAYLPFGTGERACLGRQFAITEATLAVASLIRRFDLVEHASSKPTIKLGLTSRLEGLMVQATPRRA